MNDTTPHTSALGACVGKATERHYMLKKHTTPAQITEMLTLREAGYTVAHIAQRMSLSSRTVERHLAGHGIKKGSLKQELIDEARNEMLSLVKNDDIIREKMAALVADDIAITAKLRSVMLEATDKLHATNLEEAALVMRALAAASTTFKNTSDTSRHSLSIKKLSEDTANIPSLEITGITDEEAANLHRSKMLETAALDLDDEDEDV